MVSLWHLPNEEICKLYVCVYICVRISVIKRVSSGPPCCFGVARFVLSIHDSCIRACSLNTIYHRVNGLVNVESRQENHDKCVFECFYRSPFSILDS